MTGFNYIGMGNSTNKKDAQTNAARDFLNYLVRVNEIKSEEIPAFGVSYTTICRICVILSFIVVMLLLFVTLHTILLFGEERRYKAVFLLIAILETFFQNLF